MTSARPLRVGVGGPVGAGKTQLIERITRARCEVGIVDE